MVNKGVITGKVIHFLSLAIVFGVFYSSIATASLDNSYFILGSAPDISELNVISLVDDNRISTDKSAIVLDENQLGVVSISEMVVGQEIRGTGPFSLGAINNSINNESNLIVPSKFASTRFVVPHIRYNHRYSLF